MAESSGSSKTPSKIYESVESECLAFVKECAAEFRWRDLSKDVIMDIGCGSSLNCCNAILKEFPDVKALVAVDENRSVFSSINEKDERIQLCVGNIIKRETLKEFEGKMDKVISTNLIHQVPNKKLAFENVYYMLKPGGEAAFLFALDTCFCPFIEAMLKDPPHQAIYKVSEVFSQTLHFNCVTFNKL
ncbi:hypothetical protein NPIL_344301 [Nephila pilipes]|uniref:Methyltransferase domain-containing protein n=1 Tax=Nephila pilipes TaxID=299642 RepID=A0A8X6N483_NEPPI|nr:hypothetical protein NPIL_344301 [Nephila pilipes]